MSDATPTPQPTPKGAPLWMRILLVVSLAANLAVVGIVAGVAFNAQGADGRARINLDGPNPFLRAMTRDDAQKMRRLLRPDAGALQNTRSAGRQAMETILTQLRSETVSEDVLREAFVQTAAANEARVKVGQDAIITYLLSLGPEARSDFADRLEESLTRRGPPGRGGDRPPRPNN